MSAPDLKHGRLAQDGDWKDSLDVARKLGKKKSVAKKMKNKSGGGAWAKYYRDNPGFSKKELKAIHGQINED